MFSELRHHPRFEVRLDTVDPVPQFIPRQWRGQANARDVTPWHQATGKVLDDPQVTGANRYKYFKRPLIPYTQSMGPEVVWASARQDPLSALTYDPDQQRSATPLTKVAQTQTDYRDSDVQTDPYSPDYVIRPGTQPEVVTLALLSYGCGLPAGLAEVEMIERARAKRAWEEHLPPLHDMEQMDKRRKMMEQQELAEWALREQEIEKVQEARLLVLMKLLKQREDQHSDLNAKRLDRLWSRKQEDIKAKVDRIHAEHVRSIRKMIERKRKVEGKFERRDIVEDYSSFGSQTYAPLTRIGVFIDRNSEQYVVRNKYLTNYNGLLELERSLPDFVLKPVVKAPRRQMTTSAGFLKRKYREEKELADIYQALQESKSKLGQPPKPLRFLQRVEKPIPRPPTPSVNIQSAQEEEKELAIIYLQQVVRGRSIQNMMYEGKEKRSELIKELRSTHALQAAEQQMLKENKQATLQLQLQQQMYEDKESNVDEMMSALEGETLGDTLDFLNKELIRLQEERRVHAFSLLAERKRRIREAEESGQRQVEERRRREHDEMFKQVVKVQQTTIDAYLEDVIIAAVERTANAQARQEIQEMATLINDAAYLAEQRLTGLEAEEIVSELVHGFLLPEVQKQAMRDKVQHQQRKFLIAAHDEIYSELNTYDTADGDLHMSSSATEHDQSLTKITSTTSGQVPSKPSSTTSARLGKVSSEIGSQTFDEAGKPESEMSSRSNTSATRKLSSDIARLQLVSTPEQSSLASLRQGSATSATDQPDSVHRPDSISPRLDSPSFHHHSSGQPSRTDSPAVEDDGTEKDLEAELGEMEDSGDEEVEEGAA
jgi:hypothetical protein